MSVSNCSSAFSPCSFYSTTLFFCWLLYPTRMIRMFRFPTLSWCVSLESCARSRLSLISWHILFYRTPPTFTVTVIYWEESSHWWERWLTSFHFVSVLWWLWIGCFSWWDPQILMFSEEIAYSSTHLEFWWVETWFPSLSVSYQVLCLTLLLIPYFSYCPVNFLASTLVFVTGCAPERHPVSFISKYQNFISYQVTRFTNLNAIWVPITILVINSALVVYLKTTRVIQKTSIGSLTVSFVQSQKKREHMLTRQTVALAIYLSFYEVGSFLMRTFPVRCYSGASFTKEPSGTLCKPTKLRKGRLLLFSSRDHLRHQFLCVLHGKLFN